VARWMSTGPADLVGLMQKGRIAPGADADLVVFAPDERWTVDPGRLRHRHAITPYAGAAVDGAVRRVFLRGREVTPDGAPVGALLSPEGR
jgi:allantoinase